jgi:Iron-containing redox enzyme
MPDLCEYQGLNEELMPNFIEYAKRLAADFFEGADFSADAVNDGDGYYSQFQYSPEKLDERMKCIYDAFVLKMDKKEDVDTGILKGYPVNVGRDYNDESIIRGKDFNTGSQFSNKVVKEMRRQAAPFNLVDGAWLQRILQAGPSDEVRAHLFEIWDDEAGNGKVEQNHANVYDSLMRSLGFYLPPIQSREFLSQDFLPSAFTGSVFQLCIGLFPEEFFPELLGMTLYLEWEATPTLTPRVRMLKNRGIDPHFYSLHVAIDNITAGHGFLAKEAIKLFLAEKEAEVGSSGVQLLWERIWRGYVTWATLGGLGLELIELSLAIDLKQIDLSYPMEITPEVLTDIDALHARLTSQTPDKVTGFIRTKLRPETKAIIDGALNSGSSEAIQKAILAELNILIQDEKKFYDADRFQGVGLGNDTQALLATNPSGEMRVKLNRLLLRDAFTGLILDIPTNIPPKPFPDYKSYFRKRMIGLVERKAYAAGPVHKGKLLSGTDLGDLFSNPSEMVDKLEKSPLINLQSPRDSRLLELTDFSGPMYKIFTEEEQDIILDWIESLRVSTSVPHQPISVDPINAAVAMKLMIEKLASRAEVEPSHMGLPFPDESGNQIDLVKWFDNPPGLMAAFKRKAGWVVPGNAEQSILFSQFTGPMSGALGTDIIEVVRQWIDSGAELPPTDLSPLGSQPSLALKFNDEPTLSVRAQEFALKRQFIGMGSVH